MGGAFRTSYWLIDRVGSDDKTTPPLYDLALTSFGNITDALQELGVVGMQYGWYQNAGNLSC